MASFIYEILSRILICPDHVDESVSSSEGRKHCVAVAGLANFAVIPGMYSQPVGESQITPFYIVSYCQMGQRLLGHTVDTSSIRRNAEYYSFILSILGIRQRLFIL